MVQSTTPNVPSRAQAQELIKQMQTQRDSKIVSLYHHESLALLSDGAMPTLFRLLKGIGYQERLDLWLHTRGGQTVTAWRIVQVFREFCSSFGILVPYRAHSAGTHIAMGADEINMGPFSELGPVDPSRGHPLLPLAPDGNPVSISVQDLKHFVEFLKREAGNDGITGEAYGDIMPALFEHVHPLVIGAIEQSYELAKLISRKVLGTHMKDAGEEDKIDKIADVFSDSFKEHTFQIGVSEAQALGLKAKRADKALYDSMWDLYLLYDSLGRSPQPATKTSRGETLPPKTQQLTIAHMDTEYQKSDCIVYFTVDATGRQQLLTDEWVFV